MSILYNASGGLAHLLKGLQKIFFYSIIKNKRILINTSEHIAFDYKKFSEVFYFKYFKNYKDFDNEIYDEKYIGCGSSFSKNFKKIFIKNLKLTPMYMKKINKNKLNCNKYISVHFRNTDKKNDINILLKKIRIVTKISKIKKLYLATDDSNAYTIIKTNFPKINILRHTIPLPNVFNLHKSKFENKLESCFIDIYNIINSEYFIPCVNSGLSRFIIDMILFKDNIFDIPSKTKVYNVIEYLKINKDYKYLF